jgi:hypothetical protein
MSIEKTLDSLQPYVIGIRYLEGTPIVDAVFKDGWTLPEDPRIKMVKGNDELNYYMLLKEAPGVGIDELLSFVDRTIKLNIEREKKHDLLKVKFAELKEMFKKTPLNKLKTLKFTFTEEDMVPTLKEFEMEDFDVEEPITPQPLVPEEIKHQEYEPSIEEEFVNGEYVEDVIDTPIDYAPYLDGNGNPIELSEEEQEILAEEARAEKARQYLESKGKTKKIASKVELPPKRKPVLESSNSYSGVCECGPDEVCQICASSKY